MFLVIAAAIVINLVVLFYLIRMAVKSANKDLLRQLRILTYLTAQDETKSRAAVEKVNEIDALIARKESMSDAMHESEYVNQKEKYLI